MRIPAQRLLPAGAAFFLASFAPGLSISPEALAMLDPTRQASSLCGGGGGNGGLRQALLLAAAASTAARIARLLATQCAPGKAMV